MLLPSEWLSSLRGKPRQIALFFFPSFEIKVVCFQTFLLNLITEDTPKRKRKKRLSETLFVRVVDLSYAK